MPHPATLATIAAIAAGIAILARWIAAIAPRDAPTLAHPDLPAAATVRLFQTYAAAFHRLSATGQQHLPARRTGTLNPGSPLIIAANHTAGIDPILIQAACPRFEIRWIMAADMRLPQLEWLWQFGNIIFIDRDNPRPDGLKQAIKHLKQGGCIGIFPEARLERPQRTLLPFNPGVGFLARAAAAPVVPAVITGTPDASTAWGSIGKPSRAHIQFLPPSDPPPRTQTPDDFANALRTRFQRATGWPLAHAPAPAPANQTPPPDRDPPLP